MKVRNKKSSFQKIRYALYVIFACTIAVIISIPGGQEKFRQAVMAVIPSPTPYEIFLSENPATAGQQHGKTFKYSIKFLDAIYLRTILSKSDEKLHEKNCQKAKDIFSKLPSAYSSEIKAMAQSAGLNAESLMLGNCFLDMGLEVAGCRAVVLNNENSSLQAHNLDWDSLGGVGNYMITIFRRQAGKNTLATVNLAFPGMIGALDVINEKGIALSFNQVGRGNGKCHTPIFIKMREIAETASTFDEARQALLSSLPGIPFCITLSDAKSGQASVFERGRNMVVKERTPIDNFLVADNNMWGGSNIKECVMHEIATQIKPTDTEGIKELLRHPKVLMPCNIYSVIFDYNSNVMYLASGKIPAASEKYRKFKLF